MTTLNNQPALHAYDSPVAQAHTVPAPNNTITIRLDEDAKNILREITPELRESFVTIAIKHFQYDPMYQNYFRKLQAAPLGEGVEVGVGGLGTPTSAVPQATFVNQTRPGAPGALSAQPAQPAQPAVTGGFDDW